MKVFKYILCAAVFLSASQIGYAQKQLYPVEAGSKVHFSIKNFGIATGGDVQGIKGSIIINPASPEASSADVTVDVSTIDTDNDRRDKHLQSADYFEVAKYPTIRMVSTSIKKGSVAGTFVFNGKLTIKDVSSDVSFPFSIIPQGAGYLLVGDLSINRLQYHVGGESKTMGDNIEITLKIVAE